MDKILKRILKVSPGTVREALYIETGLLNPTTIIKKEQNKHGNKDKTDWKQTTEGSSRK